MNSPRNIPIALASLFVLSHLFAGAASPARAGAMQKAKLAAIDREIDKAIDDGNIPGAVLWIESKGEIYHKAYGNRAVSPRTEPMAADTIFDVASLTKVLATTPAILHLFERGKLSLDAPVSRYIPEFLEGGVRSVPEGEKVVAEDRENITVFHLLTHQSGLPPGIFLSERDFWGYDEGVNRAATVGLIEKPGTRFRYSDVNFILLGEIVSRVSGQRIDSYVEDHFYGPLRMTDTSYLPPVFRHARVAPTTEIEDYGLVRGQVHDPTARRMEGVAGHAGVFSTARDVATFTRLLLKDGMFENSLVLGGGTIDMATSNQLPATFGYQRGLGWDIGSPFAYQRGERFPLGGFGHTGWTGTSIWVDPASETFVILLANRNHPNEGGSIKPLRIKVGTLAAEAVGYTETVPLVSRGPSLGDTLGMPTAADRSGPVLNGIDVLERDEFSALSGLTIGLVTNQTGVNRERRSTIDLLAHAPGVELKALFSPEHGIRGESESDSVDDDRDASTGLPVYSLYKSENRQPTASQLEGLDALVFDIQDIGCRFYTFVSTMGLSMEAAAAQGRKFIVLDRVNPIGGIVVDGPIRSGEGNDFVAFHDIPVQHGMTVGELARMFNEERDVGVDLTVVEVEGWDPETRFDETELPWVNPSPNIRSLTQAMLYPGIGLVEFTNLSVGRGTATPFEHVGAPWIHEGRLARRLAEKNVPGVVFLPTKFTPQSSVYEGEDCAGVRVVITDREALRPLSVGLALMTALYERHPDTFTLEEKGNVLLRHQPTLDRILAGDSWQEIREGWDRELDRFLKRREAFLLYPRD
ncbi:MAG: exo-beta-N-acetylmuramidase NamZ domain-containing protein [Verrucomicrobiales bacterium]